MRLERDRKSRDSLRFPWPRPHGTISPISSGIYELSWICWDKQDKGSPLPIVPYLQIKHWKSAVFDVAARFSKFLDHRDRGIGIACMYDNCGGTLQLLLLIKPLGYCIAGLVKIVVIIGLVVVRQQIMIQKDRIIGRG